MQHFNDINVDYNWWESTYADAAEIGIEITSFDLDNRKCTGNFKSSLSESCEKVLANHGEQAETYKTAKGFLAEWAQLVAEHSDGVNTDKVMEGKESEFDILADELENQYVNCMLNDYLKLLQSDYDYLTSEAAIIESILSNEYEFTEGGKFWVD